MCKVSCSRLCLDSKITLNRGGALTAPGRLRRLTFSFGRLKKSSRSPGRALLLLVQCSVKRATSVGLLSQSLAKPYGARRCSKVILHDFTCDIIHHFERDKRHGFRFVLLFKIVLNFFLSDRTVH